MDKRDKALLVFAAVLVLAGAWWGRTYLFEKSGRRIGEIRLDLAEEELRAHYVADTPSIKFGTAAGKARYQEVDFRYHDQSQGWISWRDEERGLDGAILVGGWAEFFMTVLDPGPAVLELEGCAVEENRPAGFRVLLNGRPLGEGTLPEGKAIVRLRFEIQEEAFRDGENRFLIEVDGGIRAPLYSFEFPLILSAFFVSASLDGVTGPDPPAPVVQGRGRERGKSIAQPSGTLLEYHCLPCRGDRLQADVSVKGGALQAAVLARRAGGESIELYAERIETGEPARMLDLDLNPFAGTPCRITLVAGDPGEAKAGTYVRWADPCITGSEAMGEQPDASEASNEPARGASGPGPDMAVILLDSASSFFFKCLQGGEVVAPAAETLAADAVVFENAVTPAPYTLPSVGSIMTGLLPDRHGVVNNANREGRNLKLSEQTATLAATLERAGYAAFGVVTNPNAANLYGYGKGFARYEELFKDPALWHEGVDPAEAVERAKTLIREHRGSRTGPFFLYLHLFQPHAPYTPPGSYTSRFAKPYDGPVDGSRAVIDGFKEKGDPPLTGRDFEHLKDLYAANLAFADDAAGAFLDWMRSEGLFDDALIVLCSDHGEAFGEHRSIEHGHHLYEEALRVPLLIKFPGGRFKGKRVREDVSLIDVAPTLAAAAGARAEGLGRDGIDLKTHLDGRAPWPERVHMARSDVFKPSYSLRWRGYQYIHDTLNRREELYYLPDDPRQNRDLLAARPVIAGYLRARLCRLLCEVLEEGGGEAVKLNDEFIQSVQDLGYTGGGGRRDAAAPASDRVCPLRGGR